MKGTQITRTSFALFFFLSIITSAFITPSMGMNLDESNTYDSPLSPTDCGDHPIPGSNDYIEFAETSTFLGIGEWSSDNNGPLDPCDWDFWRYSIARTSRRKKIS